MGGYGSGRHGGGPTVESSLVLDIDKLKRENLIAPRVHRHNVIRWNRGNTNLAELIAVVDAHDEQGTMRLRYMFTDNRTGACEKVHQRVELVTIPQPFGGRRWYALCPVTGARASKLYLPPRASRFAARGAWRRLGYQVQREADYDRSLRAAFKLRRRLGDDHGAIGDPIAKPKWMRWNTFDRQIAALNRVEARVEGHLAAFLDRLRSRHPGIQR